MLQIHLEIISNPKHSTMIRIIYKHTGTQSKGPDLIAAVGLGIGVLAMLNTIALARNKHLQSQ